MRMLRGPPDTGSHPTQMGIGFNYVVQGCLRSTMLCMSLARAHALMRCKVRWNARGLGGSNLQGDSEETRANCYQFNVRGLGNYRKVCRKYSQDKLSQGM
jgi:hypothetical protein